MKIFISQPVDGKTEEEILEERDNIISFLENAIYGPIEIINSYFNASKTGDNIDGIWNLGMSLMKLSEADRVVFGKGWNKSQDCIIEHKVCELYDIPILNDKDREN